MRFSATVIGLGKLGLPFAATLASKGVSVVGVDNDTSLIRKLNTGTYNYPEPSLNDLISRFDNNLSFSTSINSQELENDFVFILVNTPQNKSGAFCLEAIKNVLKSIALVSRNNRSSTLKLVLSSTVAPGSCEILRRHFEAFSRFQIGVDYEFYYLPDFVALGTVINDFLNPDICILGCDSQSQPTKFLQFLQNVWDNKPSVKTCSITEAEIAKVSLNAYITCKITFANIVGSICRNFKVSSRRVLSAIGSDKRIGNLYFSAGSPFGGTCFPRDVVGFKDLCERSKVSSDLIQSVSNFNNSLYNEILDKCLQYRSKQIGIYGLNFKQNTNVSENSPGKQLFDDLTHRGFHVVGYDNVMTPDISLKNFFNTSEVVVFMQKPCPDLIPKFLRDQLVINYWDNL